MTHEKAPPIFEVPSFLKRCADRGLDLADLAARHARELVMLSPEEREEALKRDAEIAQILARRHAKPSIDVVTLDGDDEPPHFLTCDYCRNPSNWSTPCGWWHWWWCDLGLECIDCGGEPPPPPE